VLRVIASDEFLTIQPIQVSRGHEYVGGKSAAREFPATRTMAVLEYSQVVLEFIADLSAQAAARYTIFRHVNLLKFARTVDLYGRSPSFKT
jgi:hypothetical protein